MEVVKGTKRTLTKSSVCRANISKGSNTAKLAVSSVYCSQTFTNEYRYLNIFGKYLFIQIYYIKKLLVENGNNEMRMFTPCTQLIFGNVLLKFIKFSETFNVEFVILILLIFGSRVFFDKVPQLSEPCVFESTLLWNIKTTKERYIVIHMYMYI